MNKLCITIGIIVIIGIAGSDELNILSMAQTLIYLASGMLITLIGFVREVKLK